MKNNKSILIVLAILISRVAYSQVYSSGSPLYTFNSLDDVVKDKATRQGYIKKELNTYKYILTDAAGKESTYNLKDNNIFAIKFSSSRDAIYIVSMRSLGVLANYVGGNSHYFATEAHGISANFNYDSTQWVTGGTFGFAFDISYHKIENMSKSYSLKQLLKECPELLKEYKLSHKEKRNRDKYVQQYFWNEIKFFKMYIACKK
jgi:hypothetical protein